MFPEPCRQDFFVRSREFAHSFYSEFSKGFGYAWERLQQLNRDINEAQPWTLAKNGEQAELEQVMRRLIGDLLAANHLLKPFLPTTAAQVEDVLARFRGDILQVPPMYSAIKINGKKLYELARKGREVERPPRPVTIHSLELTGQEGPDRFTLRVRCSKGTYVRTLCHDIGQALGCGGTMYALRRTMAAGFTLADAVTLEQALQAGDPEALLLPVDSYFSARPALTLPPDGEKKVRNGVPLSLPGLKPGEYRVYGADGTFLALSRWEQGRLTTIKSFFPV